MTEVPLFAHAAQRDVVTIEGPDASAFLQGQMSQDVEALDVGVSAWSLLLTPKGRLSVWGRLSRTGDNRFIFDVDSGHGEAAVNRLQRFMLRTDATIESASVDALFLRPQDGASVGLETEPLRPFRDRGPDLELSSGWRNGGVDLLALPDSPTRPKVPGGAEMIDDVRFAGLRILAGFPLMGAELDETVIPAEAGIVGQSASFTKGCYVGQELVTRIHSRVDNVPKRLRRIVADAELSVGADIALADAVVGAITSAAPHPGGSGWVALGYCKRTVEPGGLVAVDGSPATVEEI